MCSSDLAQRDWLAAGFGVAVGEVSEAALARDPAPHPYRRILHDRDGGLLIAEKSWRLHFRVEGSSVEVIRLASGYRPSSLATRSDDELLDGPAHRAFHARWGPP